MVAPRALPPQPTDLTQFDQTLSTAPAVTMTFIYQETVDGRRLREAFAQVISNNPDFAGRLRSKPAQQIHFDGPVGCPFEEVALAVDEADRLVAYSPRTIAEDVSQHLDLFQRLDCSVGRGITLLDTSDPICAARLAKGTTSIGEGVTVVSLSIAHMVGDAFTLFALLKAWDAEYSAPNSTRPMGNPRVNVPQSNMTCCCALASMKWFAGLIKGQNAAKKRQALDPGLVATVPKARLAALKVPQDTTLLDTNVHISTNDAVVAWLAQTLGAKLVMVQKNMRGSDGIPKEVLGNVVDGVTFGATGGAWSSMGVRKQVLKPSGPRNVNCCTVGCFEKSKWIVTTTWGKIQHTPMFGTRGPRLSVPSVDQWIKYMMTTTVLVDANDDTTLLIQSGLSPHQLGRLKKALEDLGTDVICSSITAASLSAHWQRRSEG